MTDTWKLLTLETVVKMINVLKKHGKKNEKKENNFTYTYGNTIDILTFSIVVQKKKNVNGLKQWYVLCILITFISDDDHRNLQIEVTLAPALRCTLGRAYFSFQDRFTQSDGLLERFSTIQTEHHHEQVSCNRKKKKKKENCWCIDRDIYIYMFFFYSGELFRAWRTRIRKEKLMENWRISDR